MIKCAFLPFLILCITFASCTPAFQIADTSCPGYKNVDFSRSDIVSKGLGIMPVLGGDDKEQFRRPMGDEVTKQLRLSFNQSTILSPSQVINILNQRNLSDEYTQAISDYNISGIVPKDMVAHIGQALGVKYLLYTKLLGDSDVEILNIGSSFQRVQFDEIYVQSQIWSTELGDVVWEGKGGTAKVAGYQGNIINKTASGLASILGNEEYQGPCQSKEDLVKEILKARTNTYLASILISTLLSSLLLLAI
jgi:hypothetical protein